MVVLALVYGIVDWLRMQVRSPANFLHATPLIDHPFVKSVKWVGLFATALVGLYTIEDLWDKFGDLRMPKVIP